MRYASFSKTEYSSAGAEFAPSSRTAKNTCANMSTVGTALSVSALFFLPVAMTMPIGIIMAILLITIDRINKIELNR